jgi:hypothetical protein
MASTIPMLDLMFFLTETQDNPRHVGSVLIFQKPKRGGEPVDHVHLPAGTVPLEHRRVQVGDQFVQLLVRARCRQREMQYVVARVDSLDLLPHGQADLAEDRDAVERRLRLRAAVGVHDLAHDPGAAAAGLLEDQHRADVPWVVLGFREEKHQVQHRDRLAHPRLPRLRFVQAASRSSAVSCAAFRPPAYWVSPTLS